MVSGYATIQPCGGVLASFLEISEKERRSLVANWGKQIVKKCRCGGFWFANRIDTFDFFSRVVFLESCKGVRPRAPEGPEGSRNSKGIRGPGNMGAQIV